VYLAGFITKKYRRMS